MLSIREPGKTPKEKEIASFMVFFIQVNTQILFLIWTEYWSSGINSEVQNIKNTSVVHRCHCITTKSSQSTERLISQLFIHHHSVATLSSDSQTQQHSIKKSPAFSPCFLQLSLHCACDPNWKGTYCISFTICTTPFLKKGMPHNMLVIARVA